MDRERQISLSSAIMKHMSIAKIFKDSDHTILGIEFSVDGELLAAYNQESLYIYQIASAKKIKMLNNKLTGISHLKFTHSNNVVAFLPSTPPFDLFLWSIYENEVIKSFAGPDAAAISLSANLLNDFVIVAYENSIVNIYDTNGQQYPILQMDLSSQAALAAAFSPCGNFFALAVTSFENITHLELHSFETSYKGIFKRFTISNADKISKLCIDLQGAHIILVFKDIKAVIVNQLSEEIIDMPLKLDAGSIMTEFCFSPDSKFIFMGSQEGFVRVFELRKSEAIEVTRLQGHTSPCCCVNFSYKYLLLVTACRNIIFWLPKNWD